MGKLYDKEARILKNKTISFGRNKNNNIYNIINPIKGSFIDIEKDLLELLEVNPEYIFILSADNKKICISKSNNIGVEDCYTVSDSIDDIKLNIYSWDFIYNKYKDSDIAIIKVVK